MYGKVISCVVERTFDFSFSALLIRCLSLDATTWEDATLLSDNLFGQQPPLDDYYEWRDSRVQDEGETLTGTWNGFRVDGCHGGDPVTANVNACHSLLLIKVVGILYLS